MKNLLRSVGLATAFAFVPFTGQVQAQNDNFAATPAQAPASGDDAVSFQSFYDQLADQGTWINSDQYGYVFQPSETDSNWRPYTYGHWVNTEAGMTWVSDDSFGWATDHYGRWVNLDTVGWAWVPGYTWAPAWVSWRDGGDEVGWAPLPPDSDAGIDYYGGNDISVGFGFHIGNDCDVAYGIGPAYYNFCPVAYIGDRDCYRHFRDRRDNFALIERTRNVTNINFRRDGAGRFGHVREEGPNVARLNEHAHNRIETAQLASVNGRNEAGLHGNRLGVFAPRVDRSTVRTARPNGETRNVSHAGVNRGTDINHPLALNSHVGPIGATAQQVQAARLAQTHEASGARIAHTNTHFSHQLDQPLTSMHTETHTATSAAQTQRFNSGANGGAQTHRASTIDSRFTGEPVAPTAPGAITATPGSSFTGQPGQHHSASTAQFTPRHDAAFTGAPANQRTATTSETLAKTHQYATPHVIAPTQTAPMVRHTPAYATEGATHSANVIHPSTSPFYHPQASAPTFNQSASVYHPQVSTPAFHQSAPIYHPQATAPAVHRSAPAFHPQGGFHSAAAAPQAHASGGGGFHSGGAAPAAHAGGGGAAHAAAAAPAAKH